MRGSFVLLNVSCLKKFPSATIPVKVKSKLFLALDGFPQKFEGFYQNFSTFKWSLREKMFGKHWLKVNRGAVVMRYVCVEIYYTEHLIAGQDTL